MGETANASRVDDVNDGDFGGSFSTFILLLSVIMIWRHGIPL